MAMKSQQDPMKKHVVGTVSSTVQTDAIVLKVKNIKYPCGVLQLNGILQSKVERQENRQKMFERV